MYFRIVGLWVFFKGLILDPSRPGCSRPSFGMEHFGNEKVHF